MPTDHYRRIREFMTKAGQDTPSKPVIPDEETRVLRAKLILEEALETVKALGVEVAVNGHSFNHGEQLSYAGGGEVDMEGVVDGCADISVVTIGTFIAFGVDDQPILEEVDSANLRKFATGSYRRDDGKWMKPPGWTAPDIMGRLADQGWRED